MMKKLSLGLLVMTLVISCKSTPKTNDHSATSPEHNQNKATENITPEASSEPLAWSIPNTADKPQSELVIYGEQVIAQTSKYIGPLVENVDQRFSGNNLSCKNCHLQAGKQANAIGFVGIANRYPKFRGRENREANLKERINGCMQRSLNGKSLPMESREMNAMMAYMEWLSQDIPKESTLQGTGTPDIDLLERAADPQKGADIYQNKCAVCHQSNGQGMPLNPQDLSQGYTFPPLWGSDSFNNGAGMHRVITAAKYIKANMPLGAAHLSNEEAFDVAAFINSQERPQKSDLDQDYPDRSLKPIDSPYPPYADSFSPEQHKYGPFGLILSTQKKTNE